jgi:hypothetical protein
MKHDISKHPYWTHDEFMAFLLFYAANADMECTEEERQTIRRTIPEGHLSMVEAEYHRLTDFERITVLQSYRGKYFHNEQEKAQVLEQIRSLCNADGEYDIMEKNMILMLQKVL